MSFFLRPLLAAAALLWTAAAVAQENADSLILRGFGTLGVARSSSADAEFVRDLSQTKGLKDGRWSGRIDSILGVQANWQATPEVELVGQVVSRLHYDKSRDPELMWAFAKWEPDARFSLRGGRIGADFMMLADSRLVGYAQLTVRPPADFFGPLFFSHFDGADISVTLPAVSGIVRGKLFAGKTEEKAAGTPGVWDTSGSPVSGFVLDYMNGPWLLRANLAEIRFASDINDYGMAARLRAAGAALGSVAPALAAASLAARDKATRFVSFGIVYDDGPLQVQGMLNHISHETHVFEDSHAAYLLVGYRSGSVTPFAGASWWKTRARDYATGLPDTAPFAALNAGYESYMQASRVDQHTYTLGLRWDVRSNVALKLQWDAIRGRADSRFSFARTDAGWNGRTNVISTVMDFVF